MKKQNTKRREALVLSSFGAALMLIASSTTMAAEPLKPVTPQAATKVQPALKTAPGLCNIGDEQCMLSKPFAKNLSALKQKELKVLIAKGVQVDMRDACLIC